MSVQGTLSAVDRSVRSVFVGNIPYEATEEQLKDIFSEVGPVVSFRLVYDRETGKPKGYGFCEYKDQETALSAMRNLNGYELNGRALRVDNAASEKNKEELKNLQASLGGPPQESPYGTDVDPDKAPEAISKAVASLPPEQMFELMKQMKLCIQTNPNEARNMLLQNPQLAYALLQAQVVMRIVEPQVAMAMLHRANHSVQPLHLPPNLSDGNPIAAQSVMPAPNLAAPMAVNSQSGMPAIANNNFIDQPYTGGGIALPATIRVRPALLGERPVSAAEIPPSRPLPNQFPDPRGPTIRDLDFRDPRGGGGVVVDRERDIRGPLAGGGGAILPPSRDSRDMRDPRDMREPAVPPARDPRMASGEPEARPSFDPRFRGDPRGSRGGDFDQRNFDQRGPNVFPDRGFDQQSPVYEQRGDPRAPAVSHVNPIAARGPPPAAVVPRPMQVAAAPAVRLPGAGQSPISAQDHEKAALIMQVLQLSEQQIAMLPAEQRQSIMVLKEQIARSTGVPQ